MTFVFHSEISSKFLLAITRASTCSRNIISSVYRLFGSQRDSQFEIMMQTPSVCNYKFRTTDLTASCLHDNVECSLFYFVKMSVYIMLRNPRVGRRLNVQVILSSVWCRNLLHGIPTGGHQLGTHSWELKQTFWTRPLCYKLSVLFFTKTQAWFSAFPSLPASVLALNLTYCVILAKVQLHWASVSPSVK